MKPKFRVLVRHWGYLYYYNGSVLGFKNPLCGYYGLNSNELFWRHFIKQHNHGRIQTTTPHHQGQ